MITTDHKSYRKQKVDYPNHQPGNRGFYTSNSALASLAGTLSLILTPAPSLSCLSPKPAFCKKRRADKAGRGFPAIPGLTVDWPT